MKRMWKKSRWLAAVLLIFVCMFSQALSAFATESQGETAAGSSTAAEEESLAEETGTQPADMPSAESDESWTEEQETTEEASESASDSLPVYGTEEVPETEADKEPAPLPDVEYQTHVQTFSWQTPVTNGDMSGTEGKAKRLEGIKIWIKNTDVQGDIEYQTHVQSYGWQEYKKNGEMSGTEGKAKRLEGIRIHLTGDLAEKYDVYYCVHAQTLGWLDWAKNDEMAGTSGLAKRLEGIRIVLVEKGGAAPEPLGNPGRASATLPGVTYRAHQQSYGDMDWVSDGKTCGVTGQAKRMESLAVNLTGETNLSGGIEYRTHVQTYGWQDWNGNGDFNGTTGKAKRVEALQVRLTGELANLCDVYYRLHVQGYGWLGWAKNGEMSGTSGLALRVEAIEIKIGAKSGGAPVPLGQTAYREYTGPGMYRIGNKNIYYSGNGVQGGGSGWTSNNGKRYYLVNGKPVTGWKYIGGLKYYFNGDGSLCQNLDAAGIITSGPYEIKVNKQANCVTIYAQDGANGYIIPVKAMLCSTGDDTPLGRRPTLAKYEWQSMYNGTQAHFATRLTPAPGVLFHSVTYESRNNRTMITVGYNGMGVVRSAGCIRLFCGEAYWLYTKCPVGTMVTVYNDANPGPFDRPTFTPIPENQRWDPTDPTL